MARIKTILCTLIILCTAILSCDKVPENGPLDGLWQLMEINDNGNARNIKSERLYCSFQLKLFMLGNPQKGNRAYFGRFERGSNTLRFYSFTYRSNYSKEEQSEDVLMTDDKDLDIITPWGFYSTDCTFNIEVLTDEKLVLKHENTTITYRKI